MKFHSKTPRDCSHAYAMSYSKKYAICESCKQMWKASKFGWHPVDPNYEYRPKQHYRKKKPNFKKKKKKT